MKKFACLALSAAMIFGSALGFSACDLNGGNNETGNNGGNGGNGGNGNNGASVSVEELCEALANFEVKAVEFEYESKDFNPCTHEMFVPVTGKGVAAFTETGVSLDVYQNMLSYGCSMGDNNLILEYDEYPEINLYFMRESSFYEGTAGCDENLKFGEFEKALATFKKEGGNGFEINGVPPYLTALKELYGIGMNVFSVLGGEAKAVENGYELSFTTGKAVSTLGARLMTILNAVKPEDKVASLLQNTDIVALLNDLTQNKTAKEVVPAINSMLPPDFPITLPDAKDDKETPFDYCVRIASDEAFFATLGFEDMPATVSSLSDLTIDDLAQMFMGNTGEELLALAKNYVQTAMEENGLAKAIFDDANAVFEASIVVSFDANKKPTGISGSMHILRYAEGDNNELQGGEGEQGGVSSQDEAVPTAAVGQVMSKKIDNYLTGHLTFKDSVQFADLSGSYERTTYDYEAERWNTQKIDE